MAETFTQEATAKVAEVPVEAVKALEVDATKPTQPQEKTFTKAELDAEVLKVRQEGTRREKRITELEAKAQLSDTQVRELGNLRQSVASLEDMMASLLDGQGVQAAETPMTYARRLAERRAQPPQLPQTPQLDPVIQAQTLHLDSLVEDAELSPDAPEMAVAKQKYADEGYKATVKYLKGIAREKAQPKPKETPEEMEKRIEAKIRHDLGLDSVDTSLAAGGGTRSFTRKQIADMSPEDYAKNEAAIKAAQAVGRVK